jgi:hypothetical protein
VRILDLHDDFVAREAAEREVLPQLLQAHPALRGHEAYRRLEWRQRLSRLNAKRARRQELRLFREFDAVLTAGGDRYYQEAALSVRAFPFCWPLPPSPVPVTDVAAEFDAGLIASDAIFNLEGCLYFFEKVLPIVRAHRPAFSLLVAGRICEPLRLAFGDLPGIRFLGPVGDLRAFYQSARVMVAPLLTGTGVSLKTLEALSFGCAVVSTAVGARGLLVAPGRDLVIADDAADFAGALLALLQAPARRASLGKSAQENVSSNHSTAAALARLDEVLEACAVRLRDRALSALVTRSGRR